MEETLMLPVGIEDFEDIRTKGFYYIDKTKLIEQLLKDRAGVTLFTRPRRFGKSLNMSMLRYFFEIGADPALFEGLYISRNRELCEAYQGKYPVILLSLKDVDGLEYPLAERNLAMTIGREAERFGFLADSPGLSESERAQYCALTQLNNGVYAMEGALLTSSLRILSQLLFRHYGRKTIIQIDEYDVPLDKAFQNGYYREMVALIRGVFSQALKTNNALEFAVLTGCLRVSKESIFTGLNNFKVLSIADTDSDEQFGFTNGEVRELLAYYGREDRFPEMKEWYDGYHFGDADVYCPWDVINHADRLRRNPKAEPQTYWINSSGNYLVRRFVDKADPSTRQELERLVAGEAIAKKLRLDLTYDEIDNSIDHLWSVLFTTGYLTQTGRKKADFYELRIPNREIREIYVDQIQQWFDDTVVKKKNALEWLYPAFMAERAAEIQDRLNRILSQSISVLDTRAHAEEKEIFYHGLLIGLLRSCPGWAVRSNREAGDGFADILIEPEDPDAGIVIEVKYSPTIAGLEDACERALQQIRDRRYSEYFREEGRDNVLLYGIAFCKKRCRVTAGREL